MANLLKPQGLFDSLDGQDVLVRGEAWHIEVYGVCEDAGRRWVQVAVNGPHRYMLTLALATRAGVTQALDAVSHWLENPTESFQILNVS